MQKSNQKITKKQPKSTNTIKNPETIAELEEKIAHLKNLKQSKEIKNIIKEKKKQLKNLYATAKNTTLNYEKTNRNHILFIQSTKNFYKLFDRSALFYADGIAEKLGKSARILPDDDFCDRSPIGYCAIRDIEKITERMINLGCEKDIKLSTNEVLALKLPWSYRDKDIKRLVNNNQMYLALFEKSVLPQNLFPTLFAQITELTRAVYENTRTLKDPLLKSVAGESFVKTAFKIEAIYLSLTNDSDSLTQKLSAIAKEVSLLKYQAKIIADLNVWQPSACARLADLFNKVDFIAKQELQKITKKEAKDA